MIKNKISLAVFVFGVFVVCSGGVLAGQMMALQGNVKNSTGGDLISGDLVVEIWDSLSGGSLVYNSSITYDNNITYGRYDIMLGEYNELNLDYGRNYYMAIAIDSEPLSFDGYSRRIFQPSIGMINSSFLNLTSETTVNIGGNVTSAGWFNGLYNWIIEVASRAYLSFDGSTLSFNETKLNETIDARAVSGSSSGSGSFVNYTNVKTTGSITNGSLVGYAAGTAICDAEISGSHMCTTDEVINVLNNNNYENFTATFRISEGAPGYLANANDCNGWKSDDAGYLGSIWVGSSVTGGSGSLVSCGASRAIGCCI